MNQMKKLALVPYEEWEKIKAKNPQLKNHLLKKEIQSVTVPLQQQQQPLEVSGEVKASVAIPHLQKKKKQKKKKESVTLNNPTPLPRRKPLLRLDLFAAQYRKGAKKMLKHIGKLKSFSYNEHFEVVIDNKPIPDSNIVALIEHALSKTNSTSLKGLAPFYKVLKSLHVPTTIVKNPYYKKM